MELASNSNKESLNKLRSSSVQHIMDGAGSIVLFMYAVFYVFKVGSALDQCCSFRIFNFKTSFPKDKTRPRIVVSFLKPISKISKFNKTELYLDLTLIYINSNYIIRFLPLVL